MVGRDHERHPGHTPRPTYWHNHALWTLVNSSDGSVTFHLVPHLTSRSDSGRG